MHLKFLILDKLKKTLYLSFILSSPTKNIRPFNLNLFSRLPCDAEMS